MDRFFRRLAIIAGIAFAVSGIMATAMQLGFPEIPRHWWQVIVWVCGGSLVLVFVWLFWEITIFTRDWRRSLFRNWKFRWPITRRKQQPCETAELPDRIFHFRSDVDFKRLDEFQVKLELAFFNGSNIRVVVDKITGLIICNPPFDAFPLEGPHLAVNQTAAEGRPFDRFGVTVEQRMPRELVPLIIQKLDTGMPFSFTLTSLMIWLRPVNGEDPFTAKLWHGIHCEKKQDYILCGEIRALSGRARA
jgi:hypothetical protein